MHRYMVSSVISAIALTLRITHIYLKNKLISKESRHWLGLMAAFTYEAYPMICSSHLLFPPSWQ